MKKILLASAAAVALCAPAFAADMPVKAGPVAMYSWTGCYGGLQAGYSEGNAMYRFAATNVDVGEHDWSGGLVGGTIGCNWQNGTWVWGLESDLAWSDARGRNNEKINPLFILGTKSDWLNTDRVRLGFTMNANRLLVYATGGLAVRDIGASDESPANGFAKETVSHSRTGWTAGAGLESVSPVDPRLTFKLEWLYADYGSRDVTWVTNAAYLQKHLALNENIVRIGINYKFGDGWGWGKGPVSAKY